MSASAENISKKSIYVWNNKFIYKPHPYSKNSLKYIFPMIPKENKSNFFFNINKQINRN